MCAEGGGSRKVLERDEVGMLVATVPASMRGLGA